MLSHLHSLVLREAEPLPFCCVAAGLSLVEQVSELWPNNSRRAYITTSACCFIEDLRVEFLGLGRATAPAAPSFSLKFPVILRAAFRSLPPAFPPKTYGGGIFLFRQSARKKTTCVLCTIRPKGTRGKTCLELQTAGLSCLPLSKRE